ncbi:ABC transporter permease [Haloactinomyces albus]|uniref:Peptide/nickel transport system permease protein n=1 Tax=Haloactinomyces albus TaxID=1352928 RepID=A0AAE3ZH65_9ACTN|nr:ABC transporter permease [Haloactinomyces albus]MDR7303841.1 peptide/nickel transport system permease protein [Haloactinomyces albus]
MLTSDTTSTQHSLHSPLAQARPRPWRTKGIPAGLLVAGLALVLFAGVTGAIIVPVRAMLFVVGLAAVAIGGSRLGKAVFGSAFDLTYWFSVGWLVLLGLLAAAAPWLPLAEHVDVAGTLDEPSYARPELLSEHPLGTNNFGLDLLARSIHGARTSLIIALSAIAIGTIVGGAIGILAGYFRRGVDRMVVVGTNALLAVPPLILLIALASVLEPNLRNVAIALSLLTIPNMVRLARANTMAFTQREFVLAAQAMGASRLRVMTRELLPNVLLPVLSMAMVMISVLVVAEASLSFLGLGVKPPEPTWGNMIAEGRGTVFREHPHVVLVPGVFLFLTVFAFNLVGERARKRWDPRSAKL